MRSNVNSIKVVNQENALMELASHKNRLSPLVMPHTLTKYLRINPRTRQLEPQSIAATISNVNLMRPANQENVIMELASL